MDEEDHYETLGVAYDASVKDIGRAYRVQALKCHPDKVGPDDERAAALFLRLTKAYDVLSDADKKANYDALLKARLAKKQKLAKLDGARRQMASDLERREFEAREKKYSDAMDAARQKAEIERLRDEGLRKIEEKERERQKAAKEQRDRAKLASFLAANSNDPPGTTDLDRTLKLRWRAAEEGGETITEASLKYLLATFGLIAHLLVSLPKEGKKKAKGSAIVQYAELGFAIDALDSFGKGDPGWPAGIEVEWAGGAEPANVAVIRGNRARKEKERSATPEAVNGTTRRDDGIIRTDDEPFAFPSFGFGGTGSGAATLDDDSYEAETLRKMRERAEARERERKRILEEEEREEAELAERKKARTEATDAQ